MNKFQFLEIMFKNTQKKWVSCIFEDNPQKHIPCWYRRNQHEVYVVNLRNKKRKLIQKKYNFKRVLNYKINKIIKGVKNDRIYNYSVFKK